MMIDVLSEALEANDFKLVNTTTNDWGLQVYLIENSDGKKVSITFDEGYVKSLHDRFGVYATSMILDTVRIEFNKI